MKYNLLFAGLAAMSVQAIAVAQMSQGQKPSTWQSYYKDAKVEVEYKYGDCNLPSMGTNTENIYIKVKNLQNKDVTLNFEYEIQYGDQCFNCEGGHNEYTRSIALKAGETREGQCTDQFPRPLVVFSKF